MMGMQSGLPLNSANGSSSNGGGASADLAAGAKPKKKAVQEILGEHSNLVNLDNLVTASASKPGESE